MSDDLGVIVARRSTTLSKTYLVVGLFLAVLAVLISSLGGVIGHLSLMGVSINATESNALGLSTALPMVSVALQVLAAIAFATPVLLLYVYDKNNGILEYFLSLGMSQGDIYRQYLKASLMLASGLVALEILIGAVVGLLQGTSGYMLLEEFALVAVLAVPVVSLETLIMMSFSSLQKQRVGSNQPLGTAIAVFLVLPAYITPLLAPSLALAADLLLASLIALLTVIMYLSSSRLIRREKLLP